MCISYFKCKELIDIERMVVEHTLHLDVILNLSWDQIEHLLLEIDINDSAQQILSFDEFISDVRDMLVHDQPCQC